MIVTQLPRLLDESMKEVARLHPASLALTLNMAPLSTAIMTLPANDAEVVTGSFVELFTPYGSAGIFRCTQTEDSFAGSRIVHLEHGLVTLNDRIIPGESGDITSSVREALETFLSVQDVWRLGRVDVPDDEEIAWSYDYTGVLDAVLAIADEHPAYAILTDQSKQPWTLSLVHLTDENASECRLTRNIATLNVEEDRISLCTRLYVRGLDAPMDADTIDLYGIKESFLDGGEELTQEELVKEAQRQLEDHKHPGLVVSVSAFDLSKATGESLDAFHLGKMCRVCLPEYGRTIDQRIVTLEWVDLYGEPESVRITLASKAQNTATEVKGLIVNTTTVNKKIARQGRDITLLAQNIDLKAESTEVTKLETRVKTAEVDIDGVKGEVALKASQKTVENLTGHVDELETTFTVGADGIREIIQKNDKTMAELKSTIDGLEHWVTDSKGNISELTNTVRGMESKVETADGKVSVLTNTADGLTNTVFGQGGELSQLKTRADEISAGVRDANGNIGRLSVKADSVTAKVKGVEGQVSQLSVTADGLNYTLTKHGQELSSIKALVDQISLTVKDTNGAMGQFVVKSDSITGKLEDANGKLTALQELTEDRFRVVLGDIEVVEGDIKTITGSTLWQTRDSITGVVGKIEIDADGNVVVKQGSGLRVYENGTSVGVYNENNLTAGLLVQKINGSTTAKIKADVIELDGKTIADYLVGSDLVANYLYAATGEILEINARTIDTEELTINGDEVATQPWVNGRYDTMKTWVEANYATHGWTVDHFVQKTALTTETVKVLTSASFSSTGEIAVRDASGTIIGTALTGGKVTYGTTEITYVKYA